MKLLQAIGGSETPSAADASDALDTINSMLDSWSNEGLLSYAKFEATTTLGVNTSTYTIGPSSTAAINTTRPLDIVQAYITDSTGNIFPVQILPQDKWNEIGQKQGITSQIPDTLFYDPQFPLGIINIFPSPLLNYTLTVDSLIQQVQFSTLTHSISFPPGYERAIIYNAAVEISPLFALPLPAVVMEQARESKGNVKRTNLREVISNYDPSVVSRSYATYNIYRDR
jgi:hypothetical protein